MFRNAFGFGLVVFLASCTTTPTISLPALADLAPTGKLRVGIEDVKASGLVAQRIEKHGISGAYVSLGAPVR